MNCGFLCCKGERENIGNHLLDLNLHTLTSRRFVLGVNGGGWWTKNDTSHGSLRTVIGRSELRSTDISRRAVVGSPSVLEGLLQMDKLSL